MYNLTYLQFFVILLKRWSENTIQVFCNETSMFYYVHRQSLIFYFFSLAVNPKGWATWSANCIPSGNVRKKLNFKEKIYVL